jgi:N-acetylglucosamine kinase-like BadF-type ATPase
VHLQGDRVRDMTGQLYLAVDGGGTKTHVCVSCEGLVVDGYAGASNAQDVGVQQAVTECVQCFASQPTGFLMLYESCSLSLMGSRVKRAVQAALSELEMAGVVVETDDRCPVAFTTVWICVSARTCTSITGTCTHPIVMVLSA